jgi:hypothetical protein
MRLRTSLANILSDCGVITLYRVRDLCRVSTSPIADRIQLGYTVFQHTIER